ncbi:unextended protein-like [Aricia agestis]|uniref:unextended protein-like n=1 Tax=Aricia agestis TaxID=91739 RepID=UPI001C208C04|nr:unextended protein-like [Aricia agestis]
MASVCVLRTSGVFLLLFLLNNALSSAPWILSVNVKHVSCDKEKCEYLLNVFGNIKSWSLTPEAGERGGVCLTKFYKNTANSDVKFVTRNDGKKLYFCSESENGEWFHQGDGLYLVGDDVITTLRDSENEIDDTEDRLEDFGDDLDLANYFKDLKVNRDGESTDEEVVETFAEPNLKSRVRRQAESVPETTPPSDNTTVEEPNAEEANAPNNAENPAAANAVIIASGPVTLMGLRIEESDKEPKIVDEMVPSVLSNTNFNLRLFGSGFGDNTVIAFTHVPEKYGSKCHFLISGEYKVTKAEKDSALFILKAPPPTDDYKFYICTKNSADEEFSHQGNEPWKVLATHNKLLPLWASLILIVILLMLASLFSGLNLGLMALDRTELRIIANTGTEKERKYARAIMPVRAHGNYLLCTILLSNVAVNSTFTVILDDLTSGLFAVIGSTLAIVFIAEITPQAICARHGLFIGAKSIWIMKIVMGICGPLAWPTSKLLDYFLGEEIGTHYNRERLKELVKVTNHVNDLDKEEVNIISGALDLRKKTVKDVMTKLKDCFMLPINSVLDFETMSEIVKSGYSRIPVYDTERTNIVTVLFIKDLAFVDPDDNTPLRTLCQYYQNPCNFVFEDVTLDVMLKQFKEGYKGHMAFVQRIEEGDGDPVYETVGLVTLEDVIEEMIQAEIVDESDVISDNRTKKRLPRPVNRLQDLAAFAGHHQHQRVHVSPQLVLATFQFLNTTVEPFRPDLISETVLRRLLKQDVFQHIKLRGDEDKNDPKRYVFQEGKPVDYFVLILEGRVEVTVGRENLVYEGGPFTYFGVQALTQNVGLADTPAPSTLGSLQNLNMDSMLRHSFVPDYSVKAIAEVYYLTIKRSLYLAAKRATLMEKGALNRGGTNEQIEPEVDKLLLEGDHVEDLPEIKENDKTPNKQKQFVPSSASLLTNSSFKSHDKDRSEEEKLLK